VAAPSRPGKFSRGREMVARKIDDKINTLEKVADAMVAD
jgi:hypothetical protein